MASMGRTRVHGHGFLVFSSKIEYIVLSMKSRMQCGLKCTEAHLGRSCSEVNTCNGHYHHASRIVGHIPNKASIYECVALKEGVDPSHVRAVVEGVIQKMTCSVTCKCACHTCNEFCDEYMVQHGVGKPTGPATSLFALTPCVFLDDGKSVAPLESILRCMRGEKGSFCTDSIVEENATLPDVYAMDVELSGAPPSLCKVRICARLVEGTMVFDDLFADPHGQWQAIVADKYAFAIPTEVTKTDCVQSEYVRFTIHGMFLDHATFTSAAHRHIELAARIHRHIVTLSKHSEINAALDTLIGLGRAKVKSQRVRRDVVDQERNIARLMQDPSNIVANLSVAEKRHPSIDSVGLVTQLYLKGKILDVHAQRADQGSLFVLQCAHTAASKMHEHGMYRDACMCYRSAVSTLFKGDSLRSSFP